MAFKREKFLETIGEGWPIAEGCRVSGLARSTIDRWRKDNPDFAEAFALAWENGTDALETEMLKRAKDRSDLLMIFALKARRPTVYRENVKIEAEHTHRVRPSDEFLTKFEAFSKKLREAAELNQAQPVDRDRRCELDPPVIEHVRLLRPS